MSRKKPTENPSGKQPDAVLSAKRPHRCISRGRSFLTSRRRRMKFSLNFKKGNAVCGLRREETKASPLGTNYVPVRDGRWEGPSSSRRAPPTGPLAIWYLEQHGPESNSDSASHASRRNMTPPMARAWFNSRKIQTSKRASITRTRERKPTLKFSVARLSKSKDRSAEPARPAPIIQCAFRSLFSRLPRKP